MSIVVQFGIISFLYILIDGSECLDLVATYAEVSLLALWAILLCLTLGALALRLDVKLEAYVDVPDVIYISHVVYDFATGGRVLLIFIFTFLQLLSVTLQVNS